MEVKCFWKIFFLVIFCVPGYDFRSTMQKYLEEECPRLYQKTFKGCVPKGNVSAGIYEKIEGTTTLKACIFECCSKDNCNVAFMNDNKCYHITCTTNDLCLPTRSPNVKTAENLAMVLVKPVDDDTWDQLLPTQESSDLDIQKQMYALLNDRGHFEDAFKDLLTEESFSNNMPYCEIGADSICDLNEVCTPQHPKSRSGICNCQDGFIRDPKGRCFPLILEDASLKPAMSNNIIAKHIIDMASSTAPNNNNSLPVTKKYLTVHAESKNVMLPKDEVTLIATVTTPDGPDENYQFDWISLHQPDKSTAVKHQNGGQLHLEKLTEGVYSFKVSASTRTAYGETVVNVTVLPANRINKPPKIVITPANQTIKLPNSVAVLDASSSTDDDGITAWHWELQQGPVGYEPKLNDSATLQLNDLTKPGNYTFKLTVTDTDKDTSSQTANITVLAGTDYPPEANAGEDKIIYLPHNSITLSGNLSTDDHAITTWEWTKSADDAQKAVDMQDTRTPYLQLSNLQQGMYTFTLKVTDSANQSSTAQVHVFVKPPTNKPPVAEAGANQTISLPQTWVELDASASTDDNQIMAFKWEQIEGPSTVTFENVSACKTNVTGLTKGVYTFTVSVTDDNNNVVQDKVYVTVNQNKNQKPTANAGPDFEIELPKNIVILNGSKSKDDWAIVKWKWTRDENSLATGDIVEKSDESPILMITDIGIGKYIFNLTVFDEQGLSDSDSVTFTVKNDPKLFFLVEMVIDVDVRGMTAAQYDSLKGKLSLLVKDGSKLHVRNVRPELGTSRAQLTFYVESSADDRPTNANDVVEYLRQKLRVDAKILGFSVNKLQTAICQNSCSGHGVCDEQTRMCKCEAFWMQNLFKVYLRTGEDSDCSWSILYVVLGTICGILLFLGSLWGIVHLCYTWCSKKRMSSKPTNYKLIEDADDLPPFASRKSNLSDSDTDSDVVFESRAKPSRYSDARNGHKSGRNGFGKSRRVKT